MKTGSSGRLLCAFAGASKSRRPSGAVSSTSGEIVPADELIFTVYDPIAGVLEVVATADEKRGCCPGRPDHHGHAPAGSARRPGEISPRKRVRPNAHEDEILKPVARHYRWPDSSIIVGRLIIEGKFVGSFIGRAEGKGPLRRGARRTMVPHQ